MRQQASLEPARRGNEHASPSRPLRLADIDTADFDRLPVAMAEFARVLGGGIVKGSLTLIGGDPGVGKSTLLSQVADQVAHDAGEVLYMSGEESVAQVGLRARRMGLNARDLLFLSETDADTIVETVRASRVSLAVIDSIQSVMVADVEALPGSVSQLRECALRFLQLAKSTGTPIFPGWPRHQGRLHRRPEGARAHGRYRAVPRRRARQSVPSAAQCQESLRADP